MLETQISIQYRIDMFMIFIDTNIAIGIIHKQFDLERFQSLLPPFEKIAIASISMYELYYGLYYMVKNKKGKRSIQAIEIERESIKKLKESLIIVDLDDMAANYAAEIFHRLSEQGEIIEEFDCLIAGIILSTGSSKIITNNQEHFNRIAELSTLFLDEEKQ